MAIARELQDQVGRVNLGAVSDTHCLSGTNTARGEHVSAKWVAKSIVMDDDHRRILGVAPSMRRVWPGRSREEMKRKLRLASKAELPSLCAHGEFGAIAALAPASRISKVIDDSVAEARGHKSLVCISVAEFLVSISEQCRAHCAYHLRGGTCT